ncbi:MAG TPA: M48 family metalloprotease, partial [Longimicrobiales bacterium]|nr:M48 family metalloprotease [Longimicrobiales bacterium]
VVVAAWAVHPATGRREFSLVRESEEIQMGREADPQISASLGLVDDADLQAYVSGIGMRLAEVSERRNLPWSFKVVDDPIVNAFALPGGFIYVTRGILAHFDSEAEMAGVLGHEIGHVTARHSASQISRQQLQQIGLGVGMIVSETVRDYGSLAAAGLQLMNLSYSRGDETQSDELGLRYIGRLGYEPEAMVGVFRMLAQAGGGAEGRIPEWQLTHPYPENREQHIREEIVAQGIASGGRVGRDEYLDQIDGLVYGEDPRQGFFRETRFLHPDLAFELTFPPGWQTVNQRTLVAGVAPDERAVMVLEVVPEAGAPEAELRDFLAQQGISGGPVRDEAAVGVELARATFTATTQDGSLAGEVAFARRGDVVYRILGYASRADWRTYSGAVANAISSFAELTDPAALAVQPWRIDVVTLPSATSLSTYLSTNPGPVDVEVLARLNRVDAAEVLSAGTRIKRVEGTALP